MKSKQIRMITHGAILAALYVALTYLQNWLLPGTTSAAIQFRASEALCIFALFTPAAIPGLTVGCLLFNISNAGALPLDMAALGADVVCFTGHKGLYGPQGTGGLAVAEGVDVPPLLEGGSGTHSFDERHPRFMPEALEAVRSGANPELTTRQKHTRECFVVAEEGADTAAIEKAIVTMPNYFADYDTTVTFISQEELDRDHAGIPHGGSVIRTGTTGAAGENTHVIEYSLKLDSNPEFTGSVLVACARACWRIACAGETGCRTIFDIAPALLSPMTPEELRAKML